jgi:hypothetical protein
MAWIESHQSLRDHKKTKKMARLLHIGIPQAIGHLHLLWWWCLDNAPDGYLGDIDSIDIADAALWKKEPGKFFTALIESGFVDSDALTLHDWYDYAGKLIEQRDLTKAERQAGGRARMAQLTPEDRSTLAKKAATSRWKCQQNASTPSTDMPATVPNSTVPNRTITTTVEEYASYLEELGKLKGWGKDQAVNDAEWLREFLAEYHDFNISHIRACRDYHSGKPKHNKSLWKTRIRNWMNHEKGGTHGKTTHSGARGTPGQESGGALSFLKDNQDGQENLS